MMSGPKFVNKQFNSPINLYSPQAIQETLDRQTQVLSNGAIGIDFKQLGKPANLQNSAVLRMLEEEEEKRRLGKAGLKRVAWPPPPEEQDIDSYIEQGPVSAKTRGVGDYATYQSKSPSLRGDSPLLVEHQQQPQQQQQQQQQQQRQQQPSTTLLQPSRFQAQVQPSNKSWSPVTPPCIEQHQPPTLSQDHRTPQPYYQPQSTPHFEPPPATITLRAEPPISQESAPVFPAQPAATNPNSGSMRGDQKWPPASVKEQTEAENRARIELAKGPVCRPRRICKDYSGFFSQHALTNTYPGYRAPPGTQYFTPAYQH